MYIYIYIYISQFREEASLGLDKIREIEAILKSFESPPLANPNWRDILAQTIRV
jgi:hypothetical protein